MMDRRGAGGRRGAAVPAGEEDIVARRWSGIQFQKCNIRGAVVHLQAGAGDRLGRGPVLVLCAHRAFPIEPEHPVGNVVAGRKTMIRGEKIRCAIIVAIVEQCACANSAAAHGDHRHRSYLVAPWIAHRADHVVVATSAVAQTAHFSQYITVGVRHLPDPQRSFTRDLCGLEIFDRDPITGDLRYAHRMLPAGTFLGEGTELIAVFIVHEDLRAFRNDVVMELEVDAVGAGTFDRHPPEPIAVVQRLPDPLIETKVHFMVETEPPGAFHPGGRPRFILCDQRSHIHSGQSDQRRWLQPIGMGEADRPATELDLRKSGGSDQQKEGKGRTVV